MLELHLISDLWRPTARVKGQLKWDKAGQLVTHDRYAQTRYHAGRRHMLTDLERPDLWVRCHFHVEQYRQRVCGTDE